MTGFENKKKEEWGGDRKGEFLKGLKEGRETLWRPRTFAVFHLPAFLFLKQKCFKNKKIKKLERRLLVFSLCLDCVCLSIYTDPEGFF